MTTRTGTVHTRTHLINVFVDKCDVRDMNRYYMPHHNDDDGRVTIVAGRRRHWRTVQSSTVTLSGRLETILYFLGLADQTFPNPLDDYDASVKMTTLYGASMVSPLPGLAAHIEDFDGYRPRPTQYDDSSQYVGLYHDWFEYGRHLVRHIKENLPDNVFWRREQITTS
jgi:hypothetical protein